MKITLSPEALERLRALAKRLIERDLMDYIAYDLPPRHPNCPTYGKSLADSAMELLSDSKRLDGRVIRDAEIDGGE